MKKTSKTIRMIALISLLALLLSLFSLPPVMQAQEVSNEDGLKQAVSSALVKQRNRTTNDIGLFDVRYLDNWAFGLTTIGVPVGEHGSPDDYLFLAQKTEKGWDIAIEYSTKFREWVAQVPNGLVSETEKSFLVGRQSRGNGAAQLGLPWATGETWRLTGGPHSSDGLGGRPWSALDFAGGSMLVRAAADGTVFVGCLGAFIRVTHAGGWQTGHYHIENPQVSSGQSVKRGDVLGTAGTATPQIDGCKGWAEGAHVHFSLRKDGVHQEISGHDIGGWTVSETGHYDGCMTKNGVMKCDFYSGSGKEIYNDGGTGSGEFFDEVIGTNFTDTTWWFPWFGANTEFSNWVMVGNPNNTSTTVEIYIAGQKTADSPYTIPAGGVWSPRYSNLVNGPVKVMSTDGKPIYATQRVSWVKGQARSRQEVRQDIKPLATTNGWYFPWYDSIWTKDGTDTILVANPNNTSVQAEIYIGGQKTSNSPYTIPAGGVWTPTYSNQAGGPVNVVTTNDLPVIVSQRTLWSSNSFNEVLGVPASKLDSTWWFPWYDSKGGANWILVGNPNNSSVQVEIYIAGQKTADSPYTIPAGGVWAPSYSNLVNGPVKVVSTNGSSIFASQRVLWNNSSFNEVMGVPAKQLDTTWWFPWYDATGGRVDVMMVGNPNNTSTPVEIYVGGTKTSDSPYTIPAGGVWAPNYTNLIGGPVKVVSTNGLPIFASQRVLWNNSSFNEVMGVPQSSIIPPSLVSGFSRWPFDEGTGTIANDSSANNHDGTVYGATWVTGKQGKALQFDGIDDYVEVPHHGSLNLGSQMTIAAWVKPDTLCAGDNNVIVQKDDSYGLKIRNAKAIGFMWGGSETQYTTTSLTTGKWYHLAIVYDGQKYQMYLNGVMENQVSEVITIPDSASPVRFGKGSWGCNFKGTIDDIYISSKALSQQEIKSLCGSDCTTPVNSCNIPTSPNFTESYGTVNLNSQAAAVGTLIEAINPRGQVVGCFTISTSGQYGTMRIYGEDTSVTPNVPGMRAGETVTFRVANQTATASPTLVWQNDRATQVINLTAPALNNQQTIALQPGWNLISLNVEPTTPTVAQVLSGLNYSRVLGESGSYIPTLSPSFNSLKELHAKQAYYLYYSGTSSTNLVIQGTAVAANSPITLKAGWNWLGYLPSTTLPINTALASITGQYQRVLGSTGTYIPSLPTFSTLTQLAPGQGYLVYMNNAATLTYPNNGGGRGVADSVLTACPAIAMTPYVSLVYGQLQVNGQPAPLGSRVQAINPTGQVVGCVEVTTTGQFGLMSLYGANETEMTPLTFQVNGVPAATSFRWQNDRDVHALELSITIKQQYLPLIVK